MLSQAEVDDIVASATQAGESPDKALLLRSVKSINGLVDEANKPIEFNEDTLADSLGRMNQRLAMSGSFWDVQYGRKPARKN